MMITVSIVSHGHGSMVERLIAQLGTCPEVSRILLTRNIPEATPVPADVELINNAAPKGFGANHNAAFEHCQSDYFCVLNPDIELRNNPFPELLATLRATDAALAAPLILAPDGGVEDSVRQFPTLWSLGRKLFLGDRGHHPAGAQDRPFHPDWVAGMFMLFRSGDFSRLGGFDEGYFLYYEDVDICARTWKAGMKIVVCPSTVAIHDARRASRHNWQHRRWHLSSMLRYFMRHLGRLPRVPKA